MSARRAVEGLCRPSVRGWIARASGANIQCAESLTADFDTQVSHNTPGAVTAGMGYRLTPRGPYDPSPR